MTASARLLAHLAATALLVTTGAWPGARAAEPDVAAAPGEAATGEAVTGEEPTEGETTGQGESETPRAADPPSDDDSTVVVYERTPDEGMSEEEIEERLWPNLDNLEPRYEIEDREGKTLSFSFIARYDRVDELSGRFSQSFHHDRSFYPRIALYETYSTGQDEWFYRLEFEQPLLASDHLAIGAALFDETAVFSDLVGRVGDGENTLAALFFREDFRHYLSHEGVAAYVEGRPLAGTSLRVGYLDEDHGALASTTNGSIFRPRTSFRDNPAAVEGRLKAWRFSAALESASSRRSNGLDHRHALLYESSSPGNGSDFDFERWLLDARLGWRLSVDQDLTVHVRGGGVVSGTLPIQRAFFLGGIGTLRARDYGAFVGERAYLVNVEYGFSIFRQIQFVLFHDVAAVWDRPTTFGDTRPEMDAGIALRNRSGRFRINVARDVRARQSPLVVTVRLTQPF